MSKNGLWEDISNSQFIIIIIVLFAFLLGITALATFNGTIWTTGAALVYSLIVPPFIYIEVRVKHKFMAKAVVFSVFFFIHMFLVYYFGRQWTPYPLYTLALIEYFVTLILVISVVALFCLRYLKPKLESFKREECD
ncbi:MAG: hypothetical protein ACXACF_00970 [Candidatus Hermodarchaeia archaeon]|jgi:hypothetical protein